LERPLCYPRRVVVHAEDKGGDRIYVAVREPLEDSRIFARFVEPLVHAGKIRNY
jgi:hypothetical protein